MRVSEDEYRAVELRAHSILADVPIHDVWVVDLEGEGPPRGMLDLRQRLQAGKMGASNPAVRFLFALRTALGGLFGWDETPSEASTESYLHRLSPADREETKVEPGTADGPFHALYVTEREAISEIHNATVHAFSVFALVDRPGGRRFWWAIYVQPTGRFTALYMALIDPFRRWIIYPAVLRRIRDVW